MTLQRFIRENIEMIDECIYRACPNVPKLNNEARREWIMNDEGLYNWAKAEGVKL